MGLVSFKLRDLGTDQQDSLSGTLQNSFCTFGGDLHEFYFLGLISIGILSVDVALLYLCRHGDTNCSQMLRSTSLGDTRPLLYKAHTGSSLKDTICAKHMALIVVNTVKVR